MNKMKSEACNVLGSPLKPCCFKPKTGVYRDGYCHTDSMDIGTHVVCAQVTEKFLRFSLMQGNDLLTPVPHWDFPGLKEGDMWCLCVSRWKEAEKNGVAPKVLLESMHEKALQFVTLQELKENALDFE